MRTAAPCCVVITLQAASKSQEEVRSLGCGAPRLFGYFSLSLSLAPVVFALSRGFAREEECLLI